MKSQFSQPTEPSGTGHLMIALRLDAVIAPDELQRRMEAFVADVKASPMRDASAEMLIPGETAHRTEVERRVTGIPVPASVYDQLLSLGKELGVADELKPEAG